MFLHIVCMGFNVYFMVFPHLKNSGENPIPLVFSKENFSKNLASVRDEMMPQLMKEPGKNHGKTNMGLSENVGLIFPMK